MSVASRCLGVVWTIAAAIVGALVLVAAAGGPGRLDLPTATVLGLIEGLTEFLPVSSTGHLTVAERLLELRGSAADAYIIVVQAGAILAVVLLYRDRLRAMAVGTLGRDDAGRRLAGAVGAAFVPAALVGFAAGDLIKERLFGVGPVAAAWAAGGVLIMVVARNIPRDGKPLEGLEWRQAALIGVAQVAALWPGVSRSLVTILAGIGVGLAVPAAVEFSFLLGFVTLGAATGYEVLRRGPDIVDTYGLLAPIVGFVVAFAAAVASVRWMVGYLRHGTLVPFGAYRLVAATVAVALLATGVA